MATMGLAMWLQEPDPARTNLLIMIFIGLVAVAMVVMAIAMIVVAITASKAVKGMTARAEELAGKVLPLIEVVTDISKSSQALLNDTAPKVRRITDTLVDASDTLAETSKTARSAVQQFDSTITDINMRTQRQVARVDGMVTSALTATIDAVETVSRSLRVPAQKVAAAAGQAKLFAEGLLAKVRSAAATRAGGR
jgi:methyl-accepting chemotaxis protein